MYLLQIPIYAIGILAARLLVAMRANRSLIWINAATFLTNAVADAVLSRYMGVAGIAFATAVAYLQACAILLCLCDLRLRTLAREDSNAQVHELPAEGRAAVTEPLSRSDVER
jgi:Na+-driven multidrug efflux pump